MNRYARRHSKANAIGGWVRRSNVSLAAILAGAALAGPITAAKAQNQIDNPISAFDITVDGQFTGGVVNGMVLGEWSDITPAAFISPSTQNGALQAVPLGTPGVNSLLYAGLDPGRDAIYLMYDYLPRTNPIFAPGEEVMRVGFPVSIFGSSGRSTFDALVRFVGAGVGTAGEVGCATESFFDVFVDINGETFSASQIGMEGCVGFGPSTLGDNPHLLVELEVPLFIPEGFSDPENGGAFPGSGINPETGLYDPDPKFWGSDAAKDVGDPPATAAVIQILPNGHTIINPLSQGAVPEPSTWGFLGSAVVGLIGVLRLRRRAA